MPDVNSSVNSTDSTLSLSAFGRALGEQTGIGELMDDLGVALAEKSGELCMLGGGQPAYVPELIDLFQKRLKDLSNNPEMVHTVLGEYDPADGNLAFRKAFAEMFHQLYGWGLSSDHIGIAAGGQSACFHLMNALVGEGEQVMIPLLPDYMGYRDQLVSGASFYGVEGLIEREENEFKYRLDKEAIKNAPQTVRMMAVSRPTNPSGNVLSDEEVKFLSDECLKRGVPLLIDHAYGEPFPAAVYVETDPFWAPHHIHLHSLSKLGLPGTRTAIVLARVEIITLLRNMTAVTSLANPNLGQALVMPDIKNKRLPKIAESIVKPFYQAKRDRALKVLKENFDGKIEYTVHAPEGAFFLWLWLPELKVSSKECVKILKQNGVLAISGHWFFYGKEHLCAHAEQCLRITYSMNNDEVERGISRIADTLINDPKI